MYRLVAPGLYRHVCGMIWSVLYVKGPMAGLRMVGTLALAVAAACRLIGQGARVSQIETGGVEKMGADEIARVCAARAAKK
jgi:hypothetical protein